MTTCVAIEELLRHEKSRLDEIQELQKRGAKTREERQRDRKNLATVFQRRNQWRIRQEESVIGNLRGISSETESYLQDYLRRYGFDKNTYLCIGSWGLHDIPIEELWKMSHEYFDGVLKHRKMTKKPLPGTVVGSLIKDKELIKHKIDSAKRIQKKFREFIRTKEMNKVLIVCKIQRFFRLYIIRRRRVRYLRSSMAIRTIVSFLRDVKFRKRIGVWDARGHEYTRRLDHITRIQKFFRLVLARREIRFRRRCRVILEDSRNRRAWQRDIQVWQGSKSMREDLDRLCQQRVFVEKENMEIQRLQRLEMDRCKKQYASFVTKTKRNLTKSTKLPKGWTIQEDASGEQTSSKPTYVNTMTGKTTTRHPMYEQVEKNLAVQKERAEENLALVLNQLHDNAETLNSSFDFAKRQYMSTIYFRMRNQSAYGSPTKLPF